MKWVSRKETTGFTSYYLHDNDTGFKSDFYIFKPIIGID